MKREKEKKRPGNDLGRWDLSLSLSFSLSLFLSISLIVHRMGHGMRTGNQLCMCLGLCCSFLLSSSSNVISLTEKRQNNWILSIFARSSLSRKSQTVMGICKSPRGRPSNTDTRRQSERDREREREREKKRRERESTVGTCLPGSLTHGP